jgi:hypothetical protein
MKFLALELPYGCFKPAQGALNDIFERVLLGKHRGKVIY